MPTMTPDFSRRAARVVNSPVLLGFPDEANVAFRDRVIAAGSFEALRPEDKLIFEAAEESLKGEMLVPPADVLLEQAAAHGTSKEEEDAGT